MSNKHSEPPTSTCCSTAAASTELKLYKAFIFSVPIFFTFVLLFLFYLFYLRRRRVDWSSLRMRTTSQDNNDISRAELGLKKEVRQMLPIIIYKESFSIKDTQCAVCLGDYQAEEKLQQIPSCGHAFHMDCIDPWLAIHTTCPLCRLSLLASAKLPTKTPNTAHESENGNERSVADSGDATSLQPMPDQNSEEAQEPDSRNAEAGDRQHDTEEEKECGEATNETEKHSCGFSGHA